MRDRGLEAAIEAAGGMARLAEAIGLTIGAVWQWEQVPIRRVVAVEKATGVRRDILRPDFFAPNPQESAA
jgi:DNA-binding transcriptional regulator YdaS (Cro superfamily)